MRASRAWLVVLAIAMLGLAWWRALCVLAGPDIDTDAYAHHMIARAILANPGDLAVHWVWLPLFHYLQVPLVALGGTMNHLRWANVVFTAAMPCALFAYVRATARSSEAKTPPEATALAAALFAGACPIVMQMGTTAQPEPLFALLVLGVAIAFERRHGVATAAMLGAAVLLRYEAWAVLAAIAAALVLRWPKTRRHADAARASREWTMVLVPALLILAWAALRRPVDGRWFGFLGQTREFADAALADKRSWHSGALALTRDLLYYPFVVPLRVLGPTTILVPFGVPRTWRQQGGGFVLVLVACLGFVSLSWAMRSSLGLDRHFVAVVPLYATCAAQGAAVLADRVARLLAARAPWRRASLVGRGAGVALALSALVGLGIELDVWMGFWRGSIERGWPERVALGEYLRSLSDASRIFCDDATLEVISGIDRRRFDRHWVDDPHTWDLVNDTAHEVGTVYVATWRRKLREHEGAGTIVFRAGFEPTNADATGVAVMRVTADSGRSER